MPRAASALLMLFAASLCAAPVPWIEPVPLDVHSSERGGRVEGDIDGRLEYPFDGLRAVFADPAVWCGIVALHLNVKACVHVRRGGTTWLRVYNGKKDFQRPEDAVVAEYAFAAREAAGRRLTVVLTADDGPYGTHDHRIELVLEPAANPAYTHLTLRYRYRVSFLARASLQVYLETVARGKIGFTVTGEDARGEPEYVKGLRGLIERNAVRYYLAIVAWLDGTSQPPRAALWRAARWYDLTERYARQLHELDRNAYLANKRRELAAQAELQAQVIGP
ncbi:MAG: hypothetical protein HY943_23185 [Gammaproteobacteria bacterium]|nr:hypothetical protein [Gammaproteobacteria bacterium]